MNFFYKASLSLVMIGFFLSLVFWNAKSDKQPTNITFLYKKVERGIASSDESKTTKKQNTSIQEDWTAGPVTKESLIPPTNNTIEELIKKYNLNPQPFEFGDDQYYVSRTYAYIPKVLYKKEMGGIVQTMENFVVLKPSKDQSYNLTPLMVDKNTNQVIYATGKVVIKADPKYLDDIVALAERQGLSVSSYYKEISTFYFKSDNSFNVLKQSKFFSGVPGVIYSQPEVIAAFAKTM